MKLIQEGGANRLNGIIYQGVTSSKFLGSRTISNETKPLQTFDTKTDEHGDEVGRLEIDKTTSIDMFIESLQKYIPHPLFPDHKDLARPRLMIPSGHDYEVDFLLDDFTSLTRKDVSLVEDITKVDPRQRPRKEYNHSADSTMAIIYAMTALNHDTKWFWVSA